MRSACLIVVFSVIVAVVGCGLLLRPNTDIWQPDTAPIADRLWQRMLRWQRLHPALDVYNETERATRIQRTALIDRQRGVISPFDSLFVAYASAQQLDWRLLAALAYTESRFDSMAVSRKGAQGLMQIKPIHAQPLGDRKPDLLDASTNIHSGAVLVKKLFRMFSYIIDEEERLKFVVAAFNTGPGNIIKAQHQTTLSKRDSLMWEDNVSLFCNTYTCQFVVDVLYRYAQYKRWCDKQPTIDTTHADMLPSFAHPEFVEGSKRKSVEGKQTRVRRNRHTLVWNLRNLVFKLRQPELLLPEPQRQLPLLLQQPRLRLLRQPRRLSFQPPSVQWLRLPTFQHPDEPFRWLSCRQPSCLR